MSLLCNKKLDNKKLVERILQTARKEAPHPLQDITLQKSGFSWRGITAAPWTLALIVAVIYFAAARLGLELQRYGVGVFWPAAGISAGTLIALGPRARWPVAAGVIIGNMAGNLLGDRNLWSASVFSLADAGEAIIAAALIEHSFEHPFELDRLRHVLGLLVAAPVATAASGAIGVFGYVMFHPSTASILSIWYEWLASDTFGIIAVAPLLIGIAASLRHPPTRAEFIEGSIALALLIGASSLVITEATAPWSLAVPLALSFPLLLWMGARCPPLFAAAAAFTATTTIDLTTTFGIGVFGNPTLPVDGRIHAARAGMLAVALCALVLAALFDERRRQEAALREGEKRLRVALESGHLAMWERDHRTNTYVWSDEFYRTFGFGIGEVVPSRTGWLARVHPEDRARVAANLTRIDSANEDFNNEYRIIRPDGAVRWVRVRGRQLQTDGSKLRTIGLIEDVTDAKQHIEIQNVMVAELQHRTRNLMAVVQSIARQTLDSAASMEDFEYRFDRRLEALSRVQGLLSRADSEPITIAALMRMELEAIGANAFGNRVVTQGPEVTLPKSAVEMLSLAIHELATNALKYGALANGTGRLSVTWRNEETPAKRQLVLEWVENVIARPPGAGSHRRGYGRTLIEEALPYSLGAETRFALGPDTLHCRIGLPLTSNSTREAAA